MPYHMENIADHLSSADLFAAIGTSGNVYPAAGFVKEATAFGADSIELNLDPSEVVSNFAQTRAGKATDTVPEWVEDLLT
jgi:NAD-dependent deacetylase